MVFNFATIVTSISIGINWTPRARHFKSVNRGLSVQNQAFISYFNRQLVITNHRLRQKNPFRAIIDQSVLILRGKILNITDFVP